MMIENQNTEFKKIWKDDYLKSICAFANAQGGTLWVGLNDISEITGKMPNEFGKSSEENVRRIRKTSNELGIRWSERLAEKVGSRLVEKVGGKLEESQWKIILLMEENSRITKAELSEILKISTTAIDKSITKLKKLNIIKRIGPDKGGYWEVMDNGNG